MIEQIFDFLAAYEQPVYLVGGSLRQWLLDKPVKDYDFVVSKNATKLAFQLANKFRLDCFPLDRDRDMARIVLGDLYLDFASYGNNLEADLKARDLTINAMACPVDVSLLSGDTNQVISQLIDPCAGLVDLKLGLVRGVSSENFLSDPLRMLRVYRFAACLKFKIDIETQRWVGEHAKCLNTVAMERMLQELLSILLCPDSAQWLEQLKQQRLLEHILPLEVDTLQLKEFEDMSPAFFNDVLSQYLMSPLAAQRPRLFAFKIGLLIIKSSPSRGQSSIQTQLENLTLSRKETESVIRWQNLIPNLLEIFEQDSAIKRFHLFRHAQEEFLGLFLFAKLWIKCGHILGSQELLDQLLEQWLDPNNQIAHPLQWLDGHELIKTLKIRPGPLMGQILLSLQEAQACGKLGDKADAIKYAQTLIQTLSANNCE